MDQTTPLKLMTKARVVAELSKLGWVHPEQKQNLPDLRLELAALRNGSLERKFNPKESTRLLWNLDMISSLLSLRYEGFAAQFERSSSTAQRGVSWTKLTAKFNLLSPDAFVSVEQCKTKVKNLRAEYVSLTATLNETGNSDKADDNIACFPAHWPLLVNFFGSKKGMANVNYGESASLNETEDISYGTLLLFHY